MLQETSKELRQLNNLYNLREVFHYLRDNPDDLNWNTWMADCGTIGCALGHYVTRYKEQSIKNSRKEFNTCCVIIEAESEYEFGISYTQAKRLFDVAAYEISPLAVLEQRLELLNGYIQAKEHACVDA